MKLGFIGTGKIASSVIIGITKSLIRYEKIYISQRNKNISKNLKKKFKKIGSTIEINNEKLSVNFWTTSGMMASYYELLKVMSEWLVKKGIKRPDAQKYITSLFLALSEDAVAQSKKELKFLVKESQTPKGLNEQGLKEMNKKGVYKSVINTLNLIHKRLNK